MRFSAVASKTVMGRDRLSAMRILVADDLDVKIPAIGLPQVPTPESGASEMTGARKTRVLEGGGEYRHSANAEPRRSRAACAALIKQKQHADSLFTSRRL